jgi:hypothetical protein
MDWHPWIVYAHVLGAFAFAAGHGVAATMAFRLRSERDPSRIAAILDYSLWQLSPRSLMLYPHSYPQAGRDPPELAGAHRTNRTQSDATGGSPGIRYAVPSLI